MGCGKDERQRDELELGRVVRGVDEEDLAGGLVLVQGDVVALDGAGLLPAGREELEVLDEAGLGRADEGCEV